MNRILIAKRGLLAPEVQQRCGKSTVTKRIVENLVVDMKSVQIDHSPRAATEEDSLQAVATTDMIEILQKKGLTLWLCVKSRAKICVICWISLR